MHDVPLNGLRLLAVETSILLGLTAFVFVISLFRRPRFSRPWLSAILAGRRLAVLFVIATALIGRALLMPLIGVPQPRINDEYSYLLMGDTFAHFRLTNPTPAAWQHFETFHVNLTPTYHSKYPVASGLVLAFGEIVFHQPWIGIYFATALLCGAICWTLQAFVPPGWALIGGLFAVFRLALFSYWMNSYWGGSIPALGGALALGSVVRLFAPERTQRNRALLASVFALSLLILATSRPFEGLAFSLPLLGYFAYKLLRGIRRHEIRLSSTAIPVVGIGMAGLLLMACYNRTTTGNALLMPYALNERTYAELPLFFGQGPVHQVTAHDPVFTKYYQVEAHEHGYKPDASASDIIAMEAHRLGQDWFFYVGPALSFPVLIGFLLCVKRRDLRLVLAVFVTTAAAVAACIFAQVHYFSPATIAVYVFAISGLAYLWDEPGDGAHAFAIAVCLTIVVTALTRTTGSARMNDTYRLAGTRELVAQRLASVPGKQLVLVTYDFDGHYPGSELVHNGADFTTQKILWARSKGAGKDSDLCRAYSDRSFWSLVTDDASFSLKPLALCQNQDVTHSPAQLGASGN